MAGELIETCEQGHHLARTARFCPDCGSPRVSDDTSNPVAEGTDGLGAAAEPEEPAELAGTSDEPSRPLRPLHGRRRWLPWLAAAVALLIGCAAVSWYAFVRTTDEDRYLDELRSAHLLADFASQEVALAQGSAFCAKLQAGDPAKGYKSQRVAVKYFCPEFVSNFTVVPTPEEQRVNLTTALREQGLGGRFASDATAVAHAKSVCRALDAGGVQQGLEEDAVAVSVYCPTYEAGFKTLHPIKVKGSITLLDSDPGYYYPSISGGNRSCYGDNGYSDISAGTEVVVKNSRGEVLTTTQLGQGHGLPPYDCKFKFLFTVMDGEQGKYSVSVADRGELHYSAAQLKIPHTVELSLGD